MIIRVINLVLILSISVLIVLSVEYERDVQLSFEEDAERLNKQLNIVQQDLKGIGDSTSILSFDYHRKFDNEYLRATQNDSLIDIVLRYEELSAILFTKTNTLEYQIGNIVKTINLYTKRQLNRSIYILLLALNIVAILNIVRGRK